MQMKPSPRRFNRIFHALAAMVIAASPIADRSSAQEPSDAVAVAAAQPTLQQRLDRLCEQLEKRRQDLHIPGFAIVIVKDDEIILSKGFGVRDVEKQTPVTAETLFAIGSSSKAFTAALIAMLVDEGKMNWDDTVRTHLPEFHLYDKDAEEQITIRDLLCHRSGLERTDLVWASGAASREEILAAIATAEPVSTFREAFHYQNVMFLAAGMAAANAAGMNGDWDALLAQRLLQPLGMSNSNTTLAAAAKNPQLSLGYSWDEEKQEFKRLPMRDLHSIAPAGAINSNVIDMAQWLRLQLNDGEIDGKRLIDAARFKEMREKQIDLAKGAGIGYGLGWMLREWDGKKVVEHGGNIDGFAAQVTLVPEANLGYVLLTNVSATPLQAMSVNMVCDALLGEWKETPDAPLDPTTVEDYLGKYRLDALKADVTVQIKDGKLAVDVPGQMVYTLKKPDENGKWYFEITDTIAVSFISNDANEVVGMFMHQGGLDMECPKDGVVLPVEIGLDAAQKYLGKYHDERLKVDVTVLHRNGRLAVDVPKQMVYDLRLPDDEGKWYFRATNTIAVKFTEDASGAVTGFTMYQAGREFELPRVEGAKVVSVPTADEILALHQQGCGTGGLAALGNVRLSGTMRMVNQGLNDIRFTAIANGSDQFMQHVDMGQFGWIKAGMNGDSAWSDSIFSAGEEVAAEDVPLMQLQNPMLPVLPWREVFESIEITKAERVDERDVVVVAMRKGENVRCTAFIDRETGLPIRIEYKIPVPGVGSIDTKETLTDWREILDGVMFPHRWEIESDLYGKTIVEIATLETSVDLPERAFAMPKR